MLPRYFLFVVMFMASSICLPASTKNTSSDQLLRLSYDSEVTKNRREFFVYLPVGYEQDRERAWPVIFFLHGNGERGNGPDDLDWSLKHGPLMEAWVQRRELPFIIVAPQPPLFGESEAIAERKTDKKLARLPQGVPERNYGFSSELPIQRSDAEDFPKGFCAQLDPYPDMDKLPQGWMRIEEELIYILDTVMKQFRADANRVYLTGISLGGFGSFGMLAAYPERWAAVATVVGTGKLADAETIASARVPLWMFGGGKDTVVKPHWLYDMASALENYGHPELRFTVHEDMDHDAWKRVYEGEDVFNWFLRFSRDSRSQLRRE
jgi:predicted peptidase